MSSTASPASDSFRWVAPGLLLSVALAWIGGHFSGYAPGEQAQVLVGVLHLVPIGVVAIAVRGCIRQPSQAWPRAMLLAMSGFVKAFTVFSAAWGLTHPHGFGPHSVMDWLPIGLANAGSGLILLTFIRTRPARRAPHH